MLEAALMKLARTQAAITQINAPPHFANSNRGDERASQNLLGLPYSDDQKKTRLHSHLSA